MRTISIGAQWFAKIREKHCFYIDKTDFIREWWEAEDEVTLITRPRRFGKTLNMDTLNCFFSNRYSDRGDLFEGLSIWEQEGYRQIQGEYPVIFLSFASVKETKADMAKKRIGNLIRDFYSQYEFLAEQDKLGESQRNLLKKMCTEMDEVDVANSLNFLSRLLHEYYDRKVIILLDEYDTPLQEAYVSGYWAEMAAFIRNLFNATFKTNPHLERAIMTGITRVSKESIFSDLNNLEVITTTDQKYATSFGFTQDEVMKALEEFNLSGQMETVKLWYDGFTFGMARDIYNPWSITKYLEKRKFDAYWANTSSNSLIGLLIRQGDNKVKRTMESLLSGGMLATALDEEIIFNQLDENKDAIWSMMLASGYLKIEKTEVDPENYEVVYYLKLTNFEVKRMFQKMFSGWFQKRDVPYGDFIYAMQTGNLREMNIYMSQILLEMVSSFDTAGKPSGKLHPERFYHGLVLGLMATERKYEVRSNGESGYGRYDITMVPKRTVRERGEILPSFVIEFKLYNPDAPDYEKSLEDTVKRALEQIGEKAYDTAILTQGIPAEEIYHYGFGFCGKEVLIGTDKNNTYFAT